MKLHCRHCNAQLTTDIHHTTQWSVVSDDEELSYSISLDTWILGENPYLDRATPIYMVNPFNVVFKLPVYESGMGCCNISHTEVKCPECQHVIGIANLDCWQKKSIDFDSTQCDKVIYQTDVTHSDSQSSVFDYQNQIFEKLSDAYRIPIQYLKSNIPSEVQIINKLNASPRNKS